MQHPSLLVGFGTGDDAAVYRLTEDLCVVQTVDFFPPIVDDPHEFGAIAAANALSDVYAMGGTPLLALNIVCFPERLPKNILGRILSGASEVASEAGVVIAGGHTVKDEEPKFGMSVMGTVRQDAIYRNSEAQPGDALVLTKPIGTGIITTAAKAQVADPKTVAAAIASMRELNRAASDAFKAATVHSVTDVTGFGLIGHLIGMMRSSGTSARIELSRVPLLPGTRDLAERGIVPGVTHANLRATAGQSTWDDSLTNDDRLILCDAQTSGGLLISVPETHLPQLENELESRGVAHATIGAVGPPRSNGVFVEAQP